MQKERLKKCNGQFNTMKLTTN